jgi:lantibiotic leader peptide-processing serine protease
MMRRILAVLGALAAAGCADSTTPTAPTAARPALSATAAEQSHLVLFSGEGAAPADVEATVASLGGTVSGRIDAIGGVVVSGLGDAALATLAKRSDVASLGVDYQWTLPNLGTDYASLEESATEAAPETGVESAAQPNLATVYPRQWNLRAIGADKAWAAGRRGSPNVTVAVVDGGIDYLWPDLAGRVDLARSVSFVPEDDALVAQNFPTRHPVTDLYLHGTAVASIISSNATLVAGVTSGVTLMGVKVIGLAGTTHVSTVLKGIVYAADKGADVINVSLGDHYGRDSVRSQIAAINRAVNYAHRKGATVVVAAGNDAIDMDHNGSEYVELCDSPNVICVSATGPTAAAGVNGPFTSVDAFASYSNFGSSAVDVAAPGGGTALNTKITVPCSQTSLAVPACRTSRRVLTLNGTSLASPHVAGLAALLVETLGRNPGAIREAILGSADDLGALDTDPLYGKGRINVARALGLQ